MKKHAGVEYTFPVFNYMSESTKIFRAKYFIVYVVK